MKRASPSASEMFENDSLSGGYPYNGGGNVIMPGGTGGAPTSPNPIGMGGTAPGLSGLRKPTLQQPAQAGQVGPNPMRPMSTSMPAPQGLGAISHPSVAFGGMTNSTPQGVGGMPQPEPMPGGPVQEPASLGAPVMPRPGPMPQAMPGAGLQATPQPQRSAGFGGVRPLMSY